MKKIKIMDTKKPTQLNKKYYIKILIENVIKFLLIP